MAKLPHAGQAPMEKGSQPPAPAPEEIERLKREAAQAKDQYLRNLADVENTRKRLQREKDEFVKYAAQGVVQGMLPILDSLDQALVAVDPSTRPGEAGLHKPTDLSAIIKGIHLIYRQLLDLLEKEGVTRIPTVGERFDPHQHEAVAQVEAADGTPDGTIVEEVQVGYTMHGKVIRHAMVKVAHQPRDRTPSEGAHEGG